MIEQKKYLQCQLYIQVVYGMIGNEDKCTI